MGLNLILCGRDGRFRNTTFDDCRYAGDRELAAYIEHLPGEWIPIGDPHDCERIWRPTDFAIFRQHAWFDRNEERWAQLADILEADPDLGIFLSI